MLYCYVILYYILYYIILYTLVTELRGERSGVRIAARGRDFINTKSRHSGAHPARLFDEYRDYLLAVKRPERESDHSPPPPTGAEDKNSWSYLTSLLHLLLHGMDRNFKFLSLILYSTTVIT